MLAGALKLLLCSVNKILPRNYPSPSSLLIPATCLISKNLLLQMLTKSLDFTQTFPYQFPQAFTSTSNLRAHQNFQNVIQGAIKVTNTSPSQQQAILTALQNPGQRSNQSPVRLQTGGSLVAVTVQQSPNSQQSQLSSVGTTGTITNTVTEAQIPTSQQVTVGVQGQTQQVGISKSHSSPASSQGQHQVRLN